MPDLVDNFVLPEKIKSIKWLDNGEDVDFKQEGDRVIVCSDKQLYGNQMVVKIAKIEVE